MQLTPRTLTVLCKTAVAAGATDVVDAAVVDTSGYSGVRFIFALGTITAGAATSLGVSGKATNAPTPGTDDIAGSKITVADTADDTIFIIDINAPQQRYLRPFVKRATQNAVINSIVAELYGPIKAPVAADASVTSQNLLVGPANGTA